MRRRAAPRRGAAGLAAALLALALAAGCDGEGATEREAASRGEPAARAGALALFDPFVPAPPGEMAALYLSVTDTGGEGDRLVGASSPAAGRAMLHRTRQEGGMARMEAAQQGLPVPQGGTLRLEPGGSHVMLAELRRALEPGDRLEVELVFERAGAVTLRAPVVPYAEAAERSAGGAR